MAQLLNLILSLDIWIIFRFGYTLHEKIIEPNEVPNCRCSHWECPLTITSYFRVFLLCLFDLSVACDILLNRKV